MTETNYINREKIDWKDQIIKETLSDKIETEITEFNKHMSKEERDYCGTHFDKDR